MVQGFFKKLDLFAKSSLLLPGHRAKHRLGHIGSRNSCISFVTKLILLHDEAVLLGRKQGLLCTQLFDVAPGVQQVLVQPLYDAASESRRRGSAPAHIILT